METILIVLAVILFVWSLYDYLRIGIMIKQYSKSWLIAGRTISGCR